MNKIVWKFGADMSELSSGFVKAGTIAAAAGKSLARNFEMKNVFNKTVLALGLSIEKIAEKIAEMWTGGSQEAWKAALAAAGEAGQLIEDSTLRRMSTLRQIAELEKRIRDNAAKEDGAPQKTGEHGAVRKTLDAIGENLFGAGATFFERIGAKTAAGSFSRTAEMYRKRGENGDGVETPAEAAARSAKATAERLAREAKIADLKEKAGRDQRRVDEAFLDVVRLTMTEEEKAFALQQDVEEAQKRLNAETQKGADTTEAQLEVLRKQKTLEEQLLKIEKGQTEEDRKKAEARERTLDKYRQYLQAMDRVSQAKQGTEDARYNSVAFGLEDAAGGKRGMRHDQAKARQILRDEETARRLFDSGRSITQFDSKKGRNVERDYTFFQNRAEQMRGNFYGLKTEEQKPFAAVEEQLNQANEHLAEIQASLATESLK